MSQAFGVVWKNLSQGSVELLNLCIALVFFIISLTHLNVHFQLPAIIAVSEAQERPLCGATKQPPPGICRVCLLESKLNRLWDFVSPGWLQEKPRLISI